MKKLSIGILTHDEGQYVQNIFEYVTNYIKNNASDLEFEVIVVDDFSEEPITCAALEWIQQQSIDVKVLKRSLNNDFASQKNFLTSNCTGDWIFNLDADEMIYDDLMDIVPALIESNPDIEAYWIPRINTIDGVAERHYIEYMWMPFKFEEYKNTKELEIDSEEYRFLKKINFIINENVLPNGNVMATFYMPVNGWPDYQLRLYKNAPTIRWKDTVHESISGYKTFAELPALPRISIQHHKEIRRQEKQQEKYAQIQKVKK
jgi:glycosyltransferase involved in cell wall biosynthesis